MEKGSERTVYLSPVSTDFDGLDEMNRQVTEWKARIVEGRDKRVASRTIEKMQDKLNQTGLRAPEIR
jgi:hypothetical protein